MIGHKVLYSYVEKSSNGIYERKHLSGTIKDSIIQSGNTMYLIENAVSLGFFLVHPSSILKIIR